MSPTILKHQHRKVPYLRLEVELLQIGDMVADIPSEKSACGQCTVQ